MTKALAVTGATSQLVFLREDDMSESLESFVVGLLELDTYPRSWAEQAPNLHSKNMLMALFGGKEDLNDCWQSQEAGP